MALSLRFVFAAITAFIVMLVAAITLAVTLTVSLSAIHNTGQSLASAVAATVQTQLETYIAVAENNGIDYAEMANRPEFVMPSNDSNPEWWEKWTVPMRVNLISSRYDYSSISMIFDDGGMVTVIPLDYANAYGIVVVDARTIPTTGLGIYRAWCYNKTTQHRWDTAVWGPEPSLAVTRGDQRNVGYFYQSAVYRQAGVHYLCLYFPPALQTWVVGVNGNFILYVSCLFANASNVYMGEVSFGRNIDGVGTFLQKTSKTPNTQIFVIDGSSLLVATTYTAAFKFEYDPSSPKANGSNCVSSKYISPDSIPERFGCRSTAAEYPYAPLQSIARSDPNFLIQSRLDERFSELAGDNYYYISSRVSSKLQGYTMNLVLFLPEADILGDIVAGRNSVIIATCVVFVVAAIVVVVVTGVLLKPLDDVARRMYRTARLDDMDYAFKSIDELDHDIGEDENENEDTTASTVAGSKPHVDDTPIGNSAMTEIKALQVAFVTMDTAIKSFTRYVPRDVVKELMTSNQMCEIAMRPMPCSMLFTDIAGFTSICERVPPPILSRLIRLFFERSSAQVMWHGGVIDKFIGDCIMAVFGAPVPVDHSALQAAVCGRMLVYDTHHGAIRQEFANAGEELNIRVGIATGEVLAGNMGSEMRMSYTVIGDNVNLASRLEGLNKFWGTNVMICDATQRACASYLATRFVVQVAVVGKKLPVRVHEVLGVLPNAKLPEFDGSSSPPASDLIMPLVRQESRNVLDAEYGARHDENEPFSKITRVDKIVRRCRHKIELSDAELNFAKLYSDAMEAFVRRDFEGVDMVLLRGLSSREDVPTGSADSLSVKRLLSAAEEYARNPPGDSFNGVFVATEK